LCARGAVIFFMGRGLAPAVRVAEFGVVVTLRFCQTCIFSSNGV
jgi:hypothetical protein